MASIPRFFGAPSMEAHKGERDIGSCLLRAHRQIVGRRIFSSSGVQWGSGVFGLRQSNIADYRRSWPANALSRLTRLSGYGLFWPLVPAPPTL